MCSTHCGYTCIQNMNKKHTSSINRMSKRARTEIPSGSQLPKLRLERTWGKPGSGNGELDTPQGIAIGRHGDVFVSDHGNNRIQCFNANGTFVLKWGKCGV